MEKDIQIFVKDKNARNTFWGRLKQWFWVEKLNNPVGIAVLKDGSLLVADDGGNKIWRISKQ